MEGPFLEIIEKHQGIIHKICHLYRESREDREDLFQDIVFQLWKSFPAFRKESKVSTWIYRIALNTAIATFRKKRPELDLRDQIPETAISSAGEDLSEEEEQMYRALHCLNDGEKAIISLFLDGYSYREIAEITGISENYTGVRINRIKNKLKTILK